MSALTRLDLPEGTLRILTFLLNSYTGTPIVTLRNGLKEIGLGRIAFDISFETLFEMGLIKEEQREFNDGYITKVISLTSKGTEIATKVYEIENALLET